jgi:O-antigen/teichoic acid export membrane protein
MTAAPGAGTIYLLLAVSSAALFCADPLYGALQLLGRQNIVAAFESLRGILMLLMSIAFLVFRAEVKMLAALQAVIYAGSFIAFALSTRRILALRFNPQSMLRTFGRSLIFGASGQLFALYSKLPLLSLAFFASGRATGLFSAAYRVADLAIVGGASVYLRAFIPSLFEYYHAGKAPFAAACSFLQSLMALAGVIAAATLFALAEPVITLLMGEQYRAAAHLLRWLSPTVALSFVTYVPDAAMTASNRNVVKVVFQAFATIIGAITAFLLVPRFGAMGAVFTDLIIMSVQVALFVPYAFRNGLVRPNDFSKVIPPLAGVVFAAATSNYFAGGRPWAVALWYCGIAGTIVLFWALKFGRPLIDSVHLLAAGPSSGKGVSP